MYWLTNLVYSTVAFLITTSVSFHSGFDFLNYSTIDLTSGALYSDWGIVVGCLLIGSTITGVGISLKSIILTSFVWVFWTTVTCCFGC